MKKRTALISIVVALTMILALAPGVALAAEEGSTSGSFTNGNEAPAVNSVALWTTVGTPAATTTMTPQVEYNVKVGVTDNNTLNDLNTVQVTIFYRATVPTFPGDVPLAGATQTVAILTCNVSASPSWSIDPSTSTTWSQQTSVQPTLTGTTGTFEFHFTPGKVATEATGNWYIYAKATDKTPASGDNHQDTLNMNWYGEVTVTGTVGFGSVTLGINEDPCDSPVSATYISNGNYAEQIKTDDGQGTPAAQWKGTGTNIVLLEETTTPGAGEFVLKADDDATTADYVQVKFTYVDIAADAVQTGETGATTADNTLWLSLGSTGILPDTYNGTIYYKIVNR